MNATVVPHSKAKPARPAAAEAEVEERGFCGCGAASSEKRKIEKAEGGGGLLQLFLTAIFRRTLVICTTETRGEEEEARSMEIGVPTEVRHIAHVTFDRFRGFLGVPLELQPEMPSKAPSASATVFGVSTESMQCSYDSRGNSIPTILLMLQKRLYAQGGLQTEGIFRITAENSEAEHVRDQLNSGIVPDDIDVHCLAGLIKAWFRELPDGILDCLTPEQVMECKSEDDCVQLAELLPSAEAALLDWAINLMADIVEENQHNKMNAHNVATVFAPNMTQMADPLTALMHAVQVMNFLKMLIEKVLGERHEESAARDSGSSSSSEEEDGRISDSDTQQTNNRLSCSNSLHRKTMSEGSTSIDQQPCRHTHSRSISGSEAAKYASASAAPFFLPRPLNHANSRRKKTNQTQPPPPPPPSLGRNKTPRSLGVQQFIVPTPSSPSDEWKREQ